MQESDLLKVPVVQEVDCCGEMCPGPVLKAMEALGEVESGEVVVLKTDVQAATENVRLAVETGGLAESLGVRDADGVYYLYLRKLA